MPGGFNPPLSVTENWPVPNYENPVTRGNEVLVVIGVLGGLAIVAVTLRVWSRFKIQKNPGQDDWFFLAAMPSSLGYALVACLITKEYKMDRHQWDVPVSAASPMRKMLFAQCLLYVTATCLIKLSVLSFYRRLTDRSISTAFIYTIWFFMALEAFQITVCIGTLCLDCRPVSAYWNRFLPEWEANHSYSCIPEGPTLLAMSLLSVSQDLISTILPFGLFIQLKKITLRQRVALTCTFACGLIVCAMGAYRAYVIHYLYFETYDMTWSGYNAVTASAAEILLAIIVASAPALQYYVRHTLDARRPSAPKTDPRSHQLSDMTGSTVTTKSYYDSEMGDIGFLDAITTPEEKGKAKAGIIDINSLHDDMVRWQHGRTPSTQEVELLRDGIITPNRSFEYFDRERRCIVTDDPRPVAYPWINTGPKDLIAPGL